jgi:hypothetical protein
MSNDECLEVDVERLEKNGSNDAEGYRTHNLLLIASSFDSYLILFSQFFLLLISAFLSTERLFIFIVLKLS